MRIVIDMQGAQTESRFRGIGRYTLSIVQAIIHNRGEHEIILALNGLFPSTIEPIRAAFNGSIPQKNIRVWYAPGPVRESEPSESWRREAAELIREAFLASLSPDILYITSLFEGYIDDAVTSIKRFDKNTPISASLYDLIPLVNPNQYLKPNPTYEQYYLRKINHLNQASLLLSISEFSRQEGLLQLGMRADTVVNVSTASDACFCPININNDHAFFLLKKLNIEKSFVLYTGGADDRKNLPRLIEAYAGLPQPLRNTHQLVLAGKMPEGSVNHLRAHAESAGLVSDELCITGYISDDELILLYNRCKLFVFPSWHEGFGLPALEAMACGAAVIGANTSSLPEVIGRKDALFDPLDVSAIRSKMAHVLEDDHFRESLAEHGLKQAERFSWDKCAQSAIDAFEKVHLRNVTNKAETAERLVERLTRAVAETVPLTCSETDLIDLASSISRIRVEPNIKQLFIDISELVQRDAQTGVQRVTRSILKILLECPPDGYVVEPVYATTGVEGYRYARSFMAKFLGVSAELADEPIDDQPNDIFLGLDLQHHILEAQKHYLTKLRHNGVCVVFVVYDLLPVLMPSVFLPGMDVVHKAWLETLTSFDGAICISSAVADELNQWQLVHGPKRMRPFQISWFHLGGDIESSAPTRGLPSDANNLLNELSKRPTFLIVGTIEPRKGQAQTLAAFDQLWMQGVDVNLAIVGKQGWMVDALLDRLRSHPELGKRLFWFEGVSDEYLERIYAVSTCLIAASEGEGFGLPLIEAAKHSLPIIVRDIPVFREVAGTHASYFSGTSAHSLAEAIDTWLKNFLQGRVTKSNEMPHFTWKESTQQMLQALIHIQMNALENQMHIIGRE